MPSSSPRRLRRAALLRIPALVAALLIPLRASAAQETPKERTAKPKIFAQEDGSLRVRLRERTIGFQDPAMEQSSMRVAPNGEGLMYLVMAGGGLAIARDGVTGPTYDALSTESIRYSPDGSRLAYAAVREGQAYVVLDGTAYECEPLTKSGVVFSDNGSRFGWVSREETTFVVYLDGVKQPTYDGVAPKGILFSPGGEHVAYVAGRDGKQFVVLDGEDGPGFDRIVDYWFAPGQGELAYIALDGERFVPVFAGEVLGDFGAVGRDGFASPAAGGRYAIPVRHGKVWSVLVDGEKVGEYKNVIGLNFSPNGSHVAWVAGRGEGMFLVIDGEEVTGYDGYGSVTFADEGSKLAFTAKRGEKMLAIVDGEEGEEFDAILQKGVYLSEDGSHSSYEVQVGDKHHVVVDGEVGPPFRRMERAGIRFAPVSGHAYYGYRKSGGTMLAFRGRSFGPYDEIRDISFDRNGERIGFAAQREEAWYAVVDGEESPAYAIVLSPGPVFSPTDDRVAWAFGRDRKYHVVVDGEEGPPFDIVMNGALAFTPDGAHIVYPAGTSDKRYLVVDDLVIENGYEGFLQEGGFRFHDDGRFAIMGSRSPHLMLITLEFL